MGKGSLELYQQNVSLENNILAWIGALCCKLQLILQMGGALEFDPRVGPGLDPMTINKTKFLKVEWGSIRVAPLGSWKRWSNGEEAILDSWQG